jgi:folylpolyglutamate synthase/dihydropteroate synthase
MNPWFLLGAGVLWLASVFGAFQFGENHKEASMIAEQSKVKDAREDTRKLIMTEVAHAVSQMQVRNTTIQGRTETIIRENPVYRDCRHDPASMRNINEALTGRVSSGPNGDSAVSGTDTP